MEPYIILTLIGWGLAAIAGFVLFFLIPKK